MLRYLHLGSLYLTSAEKGRPAGLLFYCALTRTLQPGVTETEREGHERGMFFALDLNDNGLKPARDGVRCLLHVVWSRLRKHAAGPQSAPGT